MNKNTSYRPSTAKSSGLKKPETKPQSLVASTTELDQSGKKITATKPAVTLLPIPAVPTVRRRTKATQASLNTLSKEDRDNFIAEYKSRIVDSVADTNLYNAVFENEEESDNNAILLSDFAIFLKMLHTSRKKCTKFFAIWLEDGLYITIISNIEFDKNFYFFPAKTVPCYRFNGKPRYYYFSSKDLSGLVTSVPTDAVLIITERLVESNDENLPESPKGSGKEVLEFIVMSSSVKTSSRQSLDIAFDIETGGYIPEEFFASNKSAASFDLPQEFDALRTTKAPYTSWDMVCDVSKHNDTVVKKIMKNEMRSCQIVYDKNINELEFSIENKDGVVSFVVTNDKEPLGNLDEPINFRLVYVHNNILKGLRKDTISQRMYISTKLPGCIKLEVSTIEHIVVSILDTKDIDTPDIVIESESAGSKKIAKKRTMTTKAKAKPVREVETDSEDELPVPVVKPKPVKGKVAPNKRKVENIYSDSD